MATDFRDVHAQRWFPDGRSLLVYATNGPGYYRFDIATGRSNLLTRCRITFHTLSRDGKTLYLVRRRQTGTPYALCSRNLETGEEHELLQNDNVSIYPAISPDGRHLAITRIQGDDSLIEILPLGGGNRREIFRVRAAEALLGFPAWSPDGREILFSRRTPKGERVELWRIPAQGGAPAKTDFSVQQVREQGQDWDSGIIVPAKTDFSVQQLRGLTFHPDGRRFVFDAGFDRTEFWAMENFLPKASK
jgi:Tol biopolymer transport system component